jgi:hypothetical protein
MFIEEALASRPFARGWKLGCARESISERSSEASSTAQHIPAEVSSNTTGPAIWTFERVEQQDLNSSSMRHFNCPLLEFSSPKACAKYRPSNQLGRTRRPSQISYEIDLEYLHTTSWRPGFSGFSVNLPRSFPEARECLPLTWILTC